MKKTVILVVVVAALVIALLLGGLPLYSRVVYHRSQAATMLAWQLDKQAYTGEADFKSYLAGKRAENALPYIIPPEVSFSVPVERYMYEAMPYFVLNAQEHPETLLIYFPGGSFIDQPRIVHWQFLDKMAADTGAMILVPVYLKLPANDAQTSYALTLDFYDAYVSGLDYDRLMFMGDSAGGGYALSMAMQLRGAGLPEPEALIVMSPWVDVTMSNPAIPEYEKRDPTLDSAMLAHLGALWAGDLGVTDPVVSPLYGDFTGLGHVTLIYSKSEVLCPDFDETVRAMEADGVTVDTIVERGMFHVWPLYVAYSIPEVQDTFAAMAAIVAG